MREKTANHANSGHPHPQSITYLLNGPCSLFVRSCASRLGHSTSKVHSFLVTPLQSNASKNIRQSNLITLHLIQNSKYTERTKNCYYNLKTKRTYLKLVIWYNIVFKKSNQFYIYLENVIVFLALTPLSQGFVLDIKYTNVCTYETKTH